MSSVDAPGLPAPGVHHGELPPGPIGLQDFAVTRHPGALLHDRLAPADDAVDERRFAHVRPADDGDDGQSGGHRSLLTRLVRLAAVWHFIAICGYLTRHRAGQVPVCGRLESPPQ